MKLLSLETWLKHPSVHLGSLGMSLIITACSGSIPTASTDGSMPENSAQLLSKSSSGTPVFLDATNGNDLNTGLLQANPVKTLERAVEVADTLQTNTANTDVAIHIIGGGADQLTATLPLDKGNGTNGGTVTVAATVTDYSLSMNGFQLTVAENTQIDAPITLLLQADNSRLGLQTAGVVKQATVVVDNQLSQIRLFGANSLLQDVTIDCLEFQNTCINIAVNGAGTTIDGMTLNHEFAHNFPYAVSAVTIDRIPDITITNSTFVLNADAPLIAANFLETNSVFEGNTIEIGSAVSNGTSMFGVILNADTDDSQILDNRIEVGPSATSFGISVVDATQVMDITGNFLFASRAFTGVGIGYNNFDSADTGLFYRVNNRFGRLGNRLLFNVLAIGQE